MVFDTNYAMKLTIFCTLLLCFQLAWSQDAFEDAIVALGQEMSYSYQNGDAYSLSDTPDETLINAFKQCSGFEGLSGLRSLRFDAIEQVKSASLIKPGTIDAITFQEWTLTSTAEAKTFTNGLNSPSPRYVQFCVSEGGMMWWQHSNKIYMITSGSYSTTFQYNKIKAVINQGLSGKARQP